MDISGSPVSPSEHSRSTVPGPPRKQRHSPCRDAPALPRSRCRRAQHRAPPHRGPEHPGAGRARGSLLLPPLLLPPPLARWQPRPTVAAVPQGRRSPSRLGRRPPPSSSEARPLAGGRSADRVWGIRRFGPCRGEPGVLLQLCVEGGKRLGEWR